MKPESIRTRVAGNPPPNFGRRCVVFVKIRTACGIEGVGEAHSFTGKGLDLAMAQPPLGYH